jgi:tetratricopeptide (TPR) repeat protein
MITKQSLIALAAGMLFGIHPVQTESVAWVAGRNDIMVGLFIVMMMYFYVKQYEQPSQSKKYTLLSAFSFLLALFTKESSAFFIVLPVMYEVVIRKTRLRKMFKGAMVQYNGMLAVSLGLYLFVRWTIFGDIIGAEKLYGAIPLENRFKLVPAMVSEYFSFFFVPLNLSIAHPLDKLRWLENPWTIISYLIVILLVASLWWSWKRDRTIAFGILWLTAGLIPTLNLFPVAVPILEHRLYAPLAGFILGLTCAAHLLFGKTQRTFVIIMASLLGICAVLSFLRLPVWRNSEALWTDAIAQEPAASRPYFNLAGYYFEKGKYNNTIDLLKKYVAMKPDDEIGYIKLQQTYLLNRQFEDALKVSGRFVSRNPKNPDLYLETGALYEQFNLPDLALRVYVQGLSADTTSYELFARTGRIYDQALNDQSNASKYYERAIRIIEEKSITYIPPPDVVELLKFMYQRTGQTAKLEALKSMPQ